MKPVAVLLVYPDHVRVGQPVTFDASLSRGSLGPTALYFFDYGDGSNSDWIAGSTVSRSYSVEGSYSARVKVKGYDDLESDWSVVVNISVTATPGALTDGGEGGVRNPEPEKYLRLRSTDYSCDGGKAAGSSTLKGYKHPRKKNGTLDRILLSLRNAQHRVSGLAGNLRGRAQRMRQEGLSNRRKVSGEGVVEAPQNIPTGKDSIIYVHIALRHRSLQPFLHRGQQQEAINLEMDKRSSITIKAKSEAFIVTPKKRIVPVPASRKETSSTEFAIRPKEESQRDLGKPKLILEFYQLRKRIGMANMDLVIANEKGPMLCVRVSLKIPI